MRLTPTAVALLALLIAAAPVSAQTLRVTAATTNLRAQAAAEAAIVATVTQGAELDVVGQEGAWYRVRVRSSGAEGFVHSLVVEPIAAAGPVGVAPAAAPPPKPVAPPQPVAASQPPPQQIQVAGPAEREFFVRVYGGVFSGYVNTGLGFGGGVAARPFDNDAMEIQGDLSYGHLGGWSYRSSFYSYDLNLTLLQGAGSFIYNFVLPNPRFTPFAGGGLAYSNTRWSGTSTSLGIIEEQTGTSFADGLYPQIRGGIEWPLNDRRAFRVELRSSFPGVMLLAGLSF